MGLITQLREKISPQKSEEEQKSYQQELRDLDSLIEDVMEIDNRSRSESDQEKSQ